MAIQRRWVVCAWAMTALLGMMEQGQAGVGRTPGAASVSPLGDAQYSIPLTVPAGTNGLTPQLSLVYDHRSGDSLLGVGWNVGGLSAITRCNKTFAQDAATAAPALTASGYG